MRVGQSVRSIISRTLQFTVDLILYHCVPEHYDLIEMHRELKHRDPRRKRHIYPMPGLNQDHGKVK